MKNALKRHHLKSTRLINWRLYKFYNINDNLLTNDFIAYLHSHTQLFTLVLLIITNSSD